MHIVSFGNNGRRSMTGERDSARIGSDVLALTRSRATSVSSPQIFRVTSAMENWRKLEESEVATRDRENFPLCARVRHLLGQRRRDVACDLVADDSLPDSQLVSRQSLAPSLRVLEFETTAASRPPFLFSFYFSFAISRKRVSHVKKITRYNLATHGATYLSRCCW